MQAKNNGGHGLRTVLSLLHVLLAVSFALVIFRGLPSITESCNFCVPLSIRLEDHVEVIIVRRVYRQEKDRN